MFLYIKRILRYEMMLTGDMHSGIPNNLIKCLPKCILCICLGLNQNEFTEGDLRDQPVPDRQEDQVVNLQDQGDCEER